jgi:hypothetical protein
LPWFVTSREKLNEAEQLFHRAISLAIPEHPLTANLKSGWAIVRMKQGQKEEALWLSGDAVALSRRVYADGHTSLAGILANHSGS